MTIARVNGVKINYDDYGSGEAIVLITGSGGRGRTWTSSQVPALTGVGYRVITVDNRGVPPSDIGPAGFTIHDMAADTAALIRSLGIDPCRIVGFSLGATIVQEVLLKHPELVSKAVLMATRGRSDAMRAALSSAWAELADSGVVLPPRYAAVMRALEYLSPCTLNDERRIRDWLDIFEITPPDPIISKAQQGLDLIESNLDEYHRIIAECLVIAFQDDLVTPAFFGREVAERIPGCKYEEIAGCGHFGYLEAPDKVNSIIIDFLRASKG
jgi:pimeloyl-ACP methyl ester carboxylesterase